MHEVIRIRKSKDRQYNCQRRTNNYLQNTSQKTKDRTTRTPLKTGAKPRLKFTKPDLFYFRSIGVCNFGIHHLEGLKSAGLQTPTINQIELHPWQRKLDIVRYCDENGIAVMAYSPLVKGKKFEDETLLQIAKRYMTVL
jgi:hypothetical protein